MRLKNKKTREIIEATIVDHGADWEIRNVYADEHTQTYNSLAELNEEWEDAPEEPKVIYPSNDNELVIHFEDTDECQDFYNKLLAWKRLKDRNLRFNLNYSTGAATINHRDVILCRIEAYFDDEWEEDNMKAEEDLDLLLGGEE